MTPRTPTPTFDPDIATLAARERIRALAHVVVIDLEATCVETREEQKTFINDVIEVGWCLLEVDSGEVVDRLQLYVRPTSSEVTPFCTRLTGIEPQTVAQAPGFVRTMQHLSDLHATHPLGPFSAWASDGNYDHTLLVRQCKREGVPFPMADWTHLNIRAASRIERGLEKGASLAASVAHYGLAFEGRHHSGIDDAVNAARVLAAVLARTAVSGLREG